MDYKYLIPLVIGSTDLSVTTYISRFILRHKAQVNCPI